MANTTKFVDNLSSSMVHIDSYSDLLLYCFRILNLWACISQNSEWL